MARCLVTGGAGFIGSHICEELIERGHKVKIIDDFSTGSKENLQNIKNKIEIVEGSITDKEKVEKAVEKTEYIFHHAAFVSVPESIKKPATTWEINIRGTKLLLNAAVKNKIKKFILASSANVYGDNPELPKKEDMKLKPTSPYGESKRIGELLCEEYRLKEKLSTICLRYFNVFGPRQPPSSQYAGVISKFIGAIAMDEKPIVYGDGTQTRDFIYIKDIVKANMLAMEKKAIGNFNIGTGEQTSVNELIDIINKALNKNIKPIYKQKREGDIVFSYANIEKARKELDFKVESSIENGIKETVDWYLKRWKR